MYDLKSLSLFALVVRHGSLTTCARDLGLPKSTLSRRLQGLEAQVGEPLLRREGNRMVPTDAGLVFEGYCHGILGLVEESRAALEELRRDVSGELSLHIHDALLRGWFADQMDRFLALHPDVRVTLRSRLDGPDPQERDILCLWLGPLPHEIGLRCETLGRLTRGLYAHPDYLARAGAPAHPADLAGHRWVDLLGDTPEGLSLQHARHGGVTVALPPSRLRVDRIVLQSDAIAKGHGIGLLPHWTVEQRSSRHPGELVPCLTDWQAPPLAVRLFYPQGQPSRRVRAFIDFLRDAVPEAWRPAAVVPLLAAAE